MEENTTQPTAANEQQGINLMDVLQSKQFESDINAVLPRLHVNDRARIRKFRYDGVQIWDTAEIAREYRKCILKTSTEPSTVRRIIINVGKAALGITIRRMSYKSKEDK